MFVCFNRVTTHFALSELVEVPLLKTDMLLVVPNIEIQPSLDDIQANFLKTMTNMVEVHKYVIAWGQRPVVPVQTKFGKTYSWFIY